MITGVDLDHTAVLGDTVEMIAAEKAGIIKQGCPVVFGSGKDSVKEVITSAAERKSAAVYLVDYSKLSDEKYSLGGTVFAFDGEAYRLSLLGEYQTENAAVVLTAVNALRKSGLLISDAAVKRGLESAVWPARFEKLSTSPSVIYDGAHNPQGIVAAVRNIKLLFGGTRPAALVGVMSDKDHRVMVDALSNVVSAVFTVTPDNPRAMDSKLLADEFASAGVEAVPFSTVEAGVKYAMEYVEERSIPLVCLGSLYMYADVASSVSKFSNDNKETGI